MSQVPQLRLVRSPKKAIPPKIQAALTLLVEACDYAQDMRCDAWDFAVEIETLRAVGLTPNDFRWLVAKGYVEPGCEKTKSCGRRRELSLCRGHAFNKRTCKGRACFILTEAGLALAAECFGSNDQTNLTAIVNHPRPAPPPHPHWDAELRELSADGRLIKRYRTRAANQEAVLTAFEEEGWPPPHRRSTHPSRTESTP